MAIETVKAVINGVETTLHFNNTSGKWEAAVNAPALSSYSQEEHKYGISVTATNTAGSSSTITRTDATFGNDLKLRVYERIKPVITIESGLDGAYITTNTPTIAVKVTDNDSGIDTSSIKCILNGTDITSSIMSGVQTDEVSDGYRFTFALPTLNDGSNTIVIKCSDNDGNDAIDVSRTFTVDTTPPTLNIVSPVDNLVTNQTSVTVSGQTNDATSSPVTVTITVNGTSVGNVTVNQDGTFSKIITLSNTNNTIVVRSTDSAGKYNEITRTVICDTSVPIFRSVRLVPNEVDAGATFTIEVEVE